MTQGPKPDDVLKILLQMNEALRAQGQMIVALQTVSTMLLTEICMLSPSPEDTLMGIGARLMGTAVGVADGLRSVRGEHQAADVPGRELTHVIDFVTRLSERSLAERLAEAQAPSRWTL